jgi:ribose transport system substrate-binding protein
MSIRENDGGRSVKIKRKVFLIAAMAIVIAMIVGCGSKSSSNESTGAKSSTPDWCKDIVGGLYCAKPAPTPPSFCGTKDISLALADGFSDNPWRQMTAAIAINEASQCPNVTSWTHTDGQGNTQKAISDLKGLAAKGMDAIVDFPDAGPAMLPAIRSAFQEGSVVVPYRAKVGGKEGVDYSVFVGTDFYQDGVDWGTWMAKALNGKGNVAYLGGPAGTSQSRERSAGIQKAFEKYPNIKWIGLKPFEVTNWDSSVTAKVLTALIAKYPQIDGIIADQDIPIVTSGAFQRAGRNLPKAAGEDGNALGCEWENLHKNGKKSSFEFSTNSAEPWNVRLAIRWAIAEAAGGKMDQPLVIKDPKGVDHVVAKAGEKIVTNFTMDDSLKGVVFCEPQLPVSASNGTSLTVEQTLSALKGGL